MTARGNFMNRILSLLLVFTVFVTCLGASAPLKWTPPTAIAGSDAVFWPSLSDDGASVAWLKLSGMSTEEATGLSIMLNQNLKGKWQKPQTLATNGVKRSFPLVESRPVMSGNGSTIVYLGLDSEKNEMRLYEIRKSASGAWGKAMIIDKVPTGWFGSVLSLDQSGNTLAYLVGEGGFMGGTQQLKILERNLSGTWSEPIAMTVPDYLGGSADPMLSSDGKKLVFLQANANFDLAFAEKKNGIWQTPVILVKNAEDKRLSSISGDGSTIFYIRNTIKNQVILGSDLFAMKRSGSAWGKPVKLNPSLIPATLIYDQALSSSEDGNRVVYANFIKKNDSISSSDINVVSYTKGVWGKPIPAVKATWGLNTFPLLSANGQRICYSNYSLQVTDGVK